MEYRIREYRMEQGMTQEVLAKKSGVSRTIISGLESGRVTVTSSGTLIKIAEALGKDICDIFLNSRSIC